VYRGIRLQTPGRQPLIVPPSLPSCPLDGKRRCYLPLYRHLLTGGPSRTKEASGT
jgi:hypothetical protein